MASTCLRALTLIGVLWMVDGFPDQSPGDESDPAIGAAELPLLTSESARERRRSAITDFLLLIAKDVTPTQQQTNPGLYDEESGGSSTMDLILHLSLIHI